MADGARRLLARLRADGVRLLRARDHLAAALLELQRQRLDVLQADRVADLELVEVLHVRSRGDDDLVALRTLDRDVARLGVDVVMVPVS